MEANVTAGEGAISWGMFGLGAFKHSRECLKIKNQYVLLFFCKFTHKNITMQVDSLFEPINIPISQQRLRMSGRSVPEIYDRLRQKWVAATPEEWVRQNFTAWLISAKGFPASLMANEVGIRLNNTLRRCDTIVYTPALKPLVIVEYKAPSVVIFQKTFDQIARYNIALGAAVLIVSNGKNNYCCRFDGSSYVFLRDVPAYEDLMRQENV